jgi:hypothetical protein
MKDGEHIKQLSDYQLLKDYVSWSYTLLAVRICRTLYQHVTSQLGRHLIRGRRVFWRFACHNELTPWSRVLDKLTVIQLVKKFPAFYVIRRFITLFTTDRHWSLSWVRWIQSAPSHPISIRSILILTSHLLLGLPNGIFPSDFQTKICYAFLISHTRATGPPSLILLHLFTIIIFGEALRAGRSGF